MNRRLLRVVGLGLVLTGPVMVAPAHGQARVVLTGGTLIDGTGAAPLPGARIVIEGGRFTCISDAAGCPNLPGDRLVDLTGRWVSPGLIDTHVHLPYGRDTTRLARFQRLRFALGITTVRDAGSPYIEPLLRERATSDAPTIPVPRLVVSARVLPEYAERYGVALGAPLVRHLAALGADAIKLKEPFDNEIWREEIQAARESGIPVWGHTAGGPPPTVFTREAITAGISGITHLMNIAPAAQRPGTLGTPPDSAADPWAWHKALWVRADQALLDSIIGEMVAQGVWFEPTMAAEYYWGPPLVAAGEPAFLGDPPGLRRLLGLGSDPPPTRPAYPDAWQRQVAFVAAFVQRGGTVVAGSDGIRPGVDLHEEIRLIGEAAGSPLEGLLAATRNAARALNRADLGTVEVGKLADLAIYATDPLGDAGATLQVTGVVKGGVLHEADSLTAEFRAEYDRREAEAWRKRGWRALRWLAAGAALVLLFLGARARLRR